MGQWKGWTQIHCLTPKERYDCGRNRHTSKEIRACRREYFLGCAPPPGYRGVDAAFDRDRRREELSRQIFAARRRGAVSSVRFTDIGNLLTQCARKAPAHQSV